MLRLPTRMVLPRRRLLLLKAMDLRATGATSVVEEATTIVDAEGMTLVVLLLATTRVGRLREATATRAEDRVSTTVDALLLLPHLCSRALPGVHLTPTAATLLLPLLHPPLMP